MVYSTCEKCTWRIAIFAFQLKRIFEDDVHYASLYIFSVRVQLTSLLSVSLFKYPSIDSNESIQ